MNSISDTHHNNNKQNENSTLRSQKLNNQVQPNKNLEENNENNQEAKSEEESSEQLSKKEKESEKSCKSPKISLPKGDQYEGETKNGKPNGKGHYISASGEEREGIFVDGLLNGNKI